ncbi:MAG: FAD-dependent oxidoreductase [Candidatus Bathyarchaeia archaeon]
MVGSIVIIGANAAGVNAAIAARRVNRDADIILITEEEDAAYSRCGLPYVLAGEIPRFGNLVMFSPSYFRSMRIELLTKTSVKTIDIYEKMISVIHEDGKAESIPYDVAVIATGAMASTPSFKGCDKQGVFSLRTLNDGSRIRDALFQAEKAVVIGANMIGLQMAYALAKNNIRTTLVDRASHVLQGDVDIDMARVVQKKVEENGVKLALGAEVNEIIGDGKARGVRVGGKVFDTDIVLLSTGIKPRTDLAKKIGCDLGTDGAVKVDCQMQTSIQGVYAAGDCVETLSLITGLPMLASLGTVAVRQGKTAGMNAAGGYSIFPGALCSRVSRVFDFEIGSTGLTEAKAMDSGLSTVSAVLNAKTKPEYFPGARDISVKIVVERDSGRIVGGQVVGGEEVAQRINMMSIAIQCHATVWELSKVDTCYSPPVSEMWESTALTADLANLMLRKG